MSTNLLNTKNVSDHSSTQEILGSATISDASASCSILPAHKDWHANSNHNTIVREAQQSEGLMNALLKN